LSKKNSNNIVVIGSSGHAKVVIDIIEKEDKYSIVGLIDTFKEIGETSFGYRILGSEQSLPKLFQSYNLCGGFIAIGDNWQRYLMAKKIKKMFCILNVLYSQNPTNFGKIREVQSTCRNCLIIVTAIFTVISI